MRYTVKSSYSDINISKGFLSLLNTYGHIHIFLGKTNDAQAMSLESFEAVSSSQILAGAQAALVTVYPPP